MQGPDAPSDPAPQGSRKGRRYPAGAAPRAAPKAFPPPGRWHGEAVTDEGCPSAGIGGRGGSGTRPYATPQIQELRAGAGPPCKGLRENCAPYRAPSPIGPHTQTGQGTVPHVVQRPGPAPHHIHPLKTASRRRATPSACLFFPSHGHVGAPPVTAPLMDQLDHLLVLRVVPVDHQIFLLVDLRVHAQVAVAQTDGGAETPPASPRRAPDPAVRSSGPPGSPPPPCAPPHSARA